LRNWRVGWEGQLILKIRPLSLLLFGRVGELGNFLKFPFLTWLGPLIFGEELGKIIRLNSGVKGFPLGFLRAIL